MDDISRDLPPDTTCARVVEEQTRGPRELLLHERAQLQERLVVRPEERPAEGAERGAPLGERVLPVAEPTAPAPEPAAGDEEALAIAPELLAAALAEEAEKAEIGEELVTAEEDGLPAVPEITDAVELSRQVFVLMLSSREGLSLLRLACACNTTQKLVEEAVTLLEGQLRQLGLPVELSRTGDTVKWLARPETFPFLQRLRGVKKLEKLSPAAFETLAVIAYRQPVMRSEIEAIRGVKAGPMLRALLQHKLVRVTGRADVPGRPLQYGTTQHFLERFGLGSLQELPSRKEWENLG
jgi:segregation and condensation protein B